MCRIYTTIGRERFRDMTIIFWVALHAKAIKNDCCV